MRTQTLHPGSCRPSDVSTLATCFVPPGASTCHQHQNWHNLAPNSYTKLGQRLIFATTGSGVEPWPVEERWPPPENQHSCAPPESDEGNSQGKGCGLCCPASSNLAANPEAGGAGGEGGIGFWATRAWGLAALVVGAESDCSVRRCAGVQGVCVLTGVGPSGLGLVCCRLSPCAEWLVHLSTG